MKTQTKYKNIIFDLGNVLTSTEKHCLDQIEKIFGNKFERSKQIVQSQTYKDLTKKLHAGFMTIEEFVSLACFDCKEEFTTLFANHHKYISYLEKGIAILDEVKSKQYKTYILSNVHKEIWEKGLEDIRSKDLLGKFDGIIASFQVNAAKPDSEIYQILLNKYSLKPEECLFIDDKEENIVAAKRLGIDGIVCDDHDKVMQELKRLGVL